MCVACVIILSKKWWTQKTRGELCRLYDHVKVGFTDAFSFGGCMLCMLKTTDELDVLSYKK